MMDCDEERDSFALNIGDSANSPDAPSAVNSSVINYYKKFGRKRDLEQFFSLSTAQSDIRDPRSAFWRRMKAPSDSSDSGDNRGKSESSLEVCRISIKCSVPELEPGTTQDRHDNLLDKSESISPPIVTEDAAANTSQHSDEECAKSDGEHSHKSMDATLDTSLNKPFSPTSSITSQRKLEWDSLADVGYANESDRKNSASGLSTLERLALKQQYSNNDTQPDNTKIGTPTAHSTPQEETDMKFKSKKGKTTKFHSREVDLVELNMPHTSQMNQSQAISVNLTKHISFNVEKDGGVTLQSVQREVSSKPDKVSVETDMTPQIKMDKEIQTSLRKAKDKSSSSGEMPRNVNLHGHGFPVLINLNTMRRRSRKKKLRTARKKLQNKRSVYANKENLPVLEKSGEQVSEAESFEYMPGHIYSQNQLNKDQPRHSSVPDNKSSLESSGALTTTDSSKASKHSFTKDLEKSITLLKSALQSRYDDNSLKQRLVKEVVERLIKSSYRGDESTTDFLSGLSFSSKKLGLRESNQTTTSTSDANNTADKPKLTKPKKSILRSDKFNSNAVSSTSQSAPNLPCASKSDLPVASSLPKPIISSTNTESDVSSKEKLSSDAAFAKTSSEELYNKYLNALRREQAYKKHLREKEMFLKQKLGGSDSALKFPVPLNSTSQGRVKDLMNDLTRNNYDDGSGDASKLEGRSGSHINLQKYSATPQKSHSVFTLSSGGSSGQYNKPNPRKNESKKSPRASHSKNEHYCCCPYHTGNIRMGVTDSSIQVDLNPRYDGSGVKPTCACSKTAPPNATGDVKYTGICTDKLLGEKNGDKIVFVKCPFQPNEDIQSQESNECMYDNAPSRSSQSNLALNALGLKYSEQSCSTSSGEKCKANICPSRGSDKKYVFVHEGIRCTQTEISINPKISDPHLSDIQIVCNCAELIGEQFREVSKSTIQSESACVGEHNADMEDPRDILNPLKEDKYVQAANEYQETVTPNPEICIPFNSHDNYRIPIQGTNMTLMVCINSKLNNDPTQKVSTIGELRIAADTVDPVGFGQGNTYPDKAALLREPFIPKKVIPHKSFPHNTYPSSKPTPHLAPIFSTGSLDHSDPQNDNRKEKLLANYEYPKTEHKCVCPETSNCGRMCTDSAECMSAKSKCVEPETEPPIKSSMKKPKCVCPESAKCGGDCGPEAKCMKLKPLLRSNTYAGVMAEPNPPRKPESARGLGAFAPNSVAPKCKCEPSAKCGGTCGPDAPCMKDKPTQPEVAITTEACEPDAPPPRKCVCSPSAKCGQTCDENAPCMKEKSAAKARPVAANSLKKYDTACEPNTEKNKSPRAISSDSDKSECAPKPSSARKCVCPPSAKCGQTCDENAPCMKKSPPTVPKDSEKSGRKSKSSAKECEPKPSEKSECAPAPSNVRKCACPPTADCGQSCDENAPCMKMDKSDPAESSTENSKAQPKAKRGPKKTMLRYKMDPEDERDEVVQTDPPSKSQSSTQTEDKSDSSANTRTRPESGKSSGTDKTVSSGPNKDLVLDMIQDITKRYSKKDIEKNQRKKCFKEIMTVLNYLLDIDDNSTTEGDHKKMTDFSGDKDAKSSECVKKTDECCGTEDVPIRSVRMACGCSSDDSCTCDSNTLIKDCKCKTIYLDKCVQSCIKKCKSSVVCPPSPCRLPFSTDNPCSTSSDTTTCRVLNKIRKECDKYHQRRCCSSHAARVPCEASSTTSVSCQNCKRTHHCYCKGYRCRGYRSKTCADKLKKKCVAYNLIIKTSESMVSEETPCEPKCRPLKNIVVKVPPKYKVSGMPFKETCTQVEEERPTCSPTCKGRCKRSRSASVSSSAGEAQKPTQVYSVREYLERNRPDFVEQCSKRQHCLKSINENSESCGPSRLQMVVVHPPNPCMDPCNTYCGGGTTTMTCNPAEFYLPSQYKYEARRIAVRKTISRELLSLQLQMQMDEPIAMTNLTESDLQRFAKQLGVDIRNKRLAPKFINERDMKKHSEKIYKTLPEVQRKKEEAKKERIMRANLIMANLFKKNLQKKTLSGAVNISNYSNVVKI